MIYAKSNPYGPIDPDRLAEFEKSLGYVLPDDFRAYLMEHNGGSPEACVIFRQGSDEPWDVFNDAFGLHDGPEYLRLDMVAEGMREFLPDDLIPFGLDPGGNTFCISITGDRKGQVFFWDHERSEGDWSVQYLAPSFTEFIENLKEDA